MIKLTTDSGVTPLSRKDKCSSTVEQLSGNAHAQSGVTVAQEPHEFQAQAFDSLICDTKIGSFELNKIYCMDCLEGLKRLPDNSVQLCIIDPPYYKIKNDSWDNQWKSFEQYLDFIEKACLEIKRVLKANGSLYIFGDDERIAYIQVRLDKHFTFLNHLVWYKPNNLPIKYAHNQLKYCPVSERCLFYSVQRSKTGLAEVYADKDCFTSLKEYMRLGRKQLMESKGFKTQEQFNNYINELTHTASVVSRHYFPDSQWVFPTKEIYEKMQTSGFWLKPYEELRQEYEELRQEYEELRRPYNYQQKIYEVINLPIITEKENTSHSTTKPRRLIDIFVKVSSNEGDTVLDCFMGSGTTALSSKHLKRNFIGFEISPEYCKIAEKRLLQGVLQ